MAQITDYDSLIKNIQESTEDDSNETNNFIPTAIQIAEQKIYRDLDLPELETTNTGNFSIGQQEVSKPGDYDLGFYFLYTNNDNERVLLEKKTDGWVLDYWPNANEREKPKYYADKNKDKFIVAPIPDDSYSFELKYLAKPSKLTSSNKTNYFTDNCPHILYFATMAETIRFMKAWNQIEVWESEYQKAVQAWNLEMARYRRDSGITPMNPEGGDNTIKHTQQTNS